MPEDLSRLSQRISELAVTVTSQDKTVEVDLEGGRTLTVRLLQGALAKHTEKSLSEEINRTVAAAMEGFQYGCDQLERKIFG